MCKLTLVAFVLITCVGMLPPALVAAPIHALIVDGRNNHEWQDTTPVLKQELDKTGLFMVDVATAPKTNEEMINYRPPFSKYAVVILNYTDLGNGGVWSPETMRDFERYVATGGAVVVIHAALSAFPKWKEYNKMIGLGGWGGRDQKAGPYVYFKNGKQIKDNTAGIGGHHGTQHPFLITIRDSHHPITRGLPATWMHEKDELYDSLRGPAKHLTILATAYSDLDSRGTGRHEPVLFTVKYRKGRIVSIAFGHDVKAMSAVDFAVIFQRSAEWAATGDVTQHIPTDFPTAASVSSKR